MFDTVGVLTRDKETWSIEREGDAAELADRTHAWLQSLDRAKSAKWDKLLGKWQPFLMLLMGLIAVIAPRIAETSSKRKHALAASQENRSGSSSTRGSATEPAPGPIANQSVNRNGNGGPGSVGGNVPVTEGFRPLRNSDFAELFAETNGPTM